MVTCLQRSWLSLARLAIACFLTVGGEWPASAQAPPAAAASPAVGDTHKRHIDFSDRVPVTGGHLFRIWLEDQKDIATSPFRLRPSDAKWLLPAAATIGYTFHRDTYLVNRLHSASGDGAFSRRLSDASAAALGGIAASLYLSGKFTHNDSRREAGLLSFLALANTVPMTYGLKYALGRERPLVANGRGDFFAGGESFPSQHAAAAWSLAAVLARKYPGPLTQVLAYGLATTASLSRVSGRRHFPTDVLVGSLLGYQIGKRTYERHASPLYGFGTFTHEGEPQPLAKGSPNVPLDSWVYEALDRLAGRRMIDSGFFGLRPWTRLECARLTQEARTNVAQASTQEAESDRVVAALEMEFADEIDRLEGRQAGRRFHLQSVYHRVIAIARTPLDDGYHFGQTMWNDQGRPHRTGWNNVTGFAAYAAGGPWVAFIQGEYQHSPAAPALSLSARTEIGRIDRNTPPPPGTSFPAINRFRLIEAYAGFNVGQWQFTFGKQALHWSPNASGALLFSENAEPLLMFRLSRTSPAVLPGWLGYLGPLRTEFLAGRLEGHQYVRTSAGFFTAPFDRPILINGAKLMFKPTKNFEYGVAVTSVFAGPGYPLNAKTFLRSFGISNTFPGQAKDPGDRRAGFDFKYRLPGLRRWLTLYNDALSEDEISPLGFPRRSAMAPGLYAPQLPGLAKIDLRAEGYYTDLPGLRSTGLFYSNFRFINGYTNFGNLVGHPVGRQGSGFMLRSTYHASPRNAVGFQFRRNLVSEQFLSGGGNQSQYQTQWRWTWGRAEISGQVQYENWRFPVVKPGRNSDVATMLQVRFEPRLP